MKFVVARSEILTRLESVSGAVASKSVKPILSGIYFSMKDESTIKLVATDLETAITTELKPKHIDGSCDFVIDARLVLEIVRNLPEGEVIFETEETNVVIRLGSAQFTLPTMDPGDFPDIEAAAGGLDFTVSVSSVELMIDRVIFCAARDEFMRNLNSVYWEFDDGYVRLVAADGFRMALSEERIDLSIEDHFLLTLKSMRDLQNSLKAAMSDIMRVVYDGSRVQFFFDGTEIVTKVVDAEFPDYKKVLPKSFKARVVLPAVTFSDAVRRASIAARLGSDSVKFEINDEEFKIIARSPDHGESIEVIKTSKEGDNIIIAFNPRFLSEAVKKVDSEMVELNFVDSNSPLQMNPVDIQGYTYIIMPIRLI
ncbi:DNA polymerase III subunit beta [Mesotoga sp.]|uniref:DNA polymerase III subunit beta n=1 Tax=Mesotoga sp. TaxID=2053577 RepID=UPI001BD635DA|nr:DNA polymerase III subunit beta [Mesotoga sp.]